MKHQHVPDQEKCPSQDMWPRPRNIFWIKIYVQDQIKCLKPRKMSLLWWDTKRNMSQTKKMSQTKINVMSQAKINIIFQMRPQHIADWAIWPRLRYMTQTKIYDPDWDIWPRPRYMTQTKEYILDWDICSYTDGILKCPRLWIMPQNNIYPRPRDMSKTLQNIAMFQTHNCWWVWISIEWTWIWFEPNILVYLQPEPW